MLFVNEEFEDFPPVFSEPKKVRPETDDEMARRIKCMLGEFVHEKDYQVKACEETFKEAVETSKSLSGTLSNQKSSDQQKMEVQNILEDSKENNETAINGIEEVSENIENTNSLNNKVITDNTINFQNSAPEVSPANSRRCSLKRQCKERISLLDYNPMFTIRTKKSKGSSSSKGKSEQFEFPTLKKFPEIQLIDCLSEVPNQDPPLLLDTSHVSSYKENDMSFPSDNEYKGNNISKDSYNEGKVSFQLGTLDKKQLKKKKKKKIRYESLPITEGSNLAGSAQEHSELLGDSKIGSCQIKNGIIKIRLSKLHDKSKEVSQNKYEVSFSEKDALSNCKKLSVPLSPLAPAVYDVYCASYKKKKHSKTFKKRKHGEIGKKLGNTLTPESNVNSACVESSKTEVGSQNMNVLTEEASSVGTCVTKSVNIVPEEVTDKSMELYKKIEMPHVTDNINDDKFKSADSGSAQETNLPVKTPEFLLLPSFERELNDSKIMCSINLSLIDRIPKKTTLNNETTDQTISKCSDRTGVEAMSLNNCPYSNLDCMQILEENSNVKDEIFTPVYHNNPPSDCDLNGSKGSIQHRLTPESYMDDPCPNLTPVYPFEAPIAEDDTFINSCHKLSVSLDTSYPGNKSFRSDNLVKEAKRVNSSILSQDSHLNKIKIEVPDAILSNHERWNEYKEYKWCRDFTDVIYRNGGALFKEQFAYSGLWQDPELRKQYSSEYYLNEAKKLKHQADKEIDRMVQAMKYLEAVLYFILTGNAMEHSYIDTDRVHTMYKETLALIRFISSKFQKLHNASCRNIDNKLTVLSLRCQSLLYLKMYQLRRDEVRSLHRTLTTFLKSESVVGPDQISSPHLQVSARQGSIHSQVSPCHQASPCSLTPSPAGSVASISSQSSGYNSSEIGLSLTAVSSNSNVPLQSDTFSDPITVSRSKYKMLQQQNAYLTNLHLCHDLWEHADYLSSKEHSREFFLELDEECGCLSLHSPFSALVHYVRKGLYKLKDGT